MFVFRNQSFVERENAAQGGIDFPRKLAGIRAHHFGTGVQATRSKSSSAPYTALVSVSKLLESSESFGFKGGGLIRGGPPMWTLENRPKYNRDHLRYSSDLTDDEWAYIKL